MPQTTTSKGTHEDTLKLLVSLGQLLRSVLNVVVGSGSVLLEVGGREEVGGERRRSEDLAFRRDVGLVFRAQRKRRGSLSMQSLWER